MLFQLRQLLTVKKAEKAGKNRKAGISSSRQKLPQTGGSDPLKELNEVMAYLELRQISIMERFAKTVNNR